MRSMLSRALQRSGYDVIEAADGAAGLAALESRLPQLVVTDIIMPGKEGLELIMDLRRTHPDIPIIAISGGGRLEPSVHLKLAQASGAARIFEKPLQLEAFLEAVNTLLKPKS